MTLRLPFSQAKDVAALLEALSTRDATIREQGCQLQELRNVGVELEQTMARQAELISDLELHLGRNSSKPPALKRTNVKGRKPGGQKGRKGKTLCCSDGTDHVVNHFPSGCSHCEHGLEHSRMFSALNRRKERSSTWLHGWPAGSVDLGSMLGRWSVSRSSTWMGPVSRPGAGSTGCMLRVQVY